MMKNKILLPLLALSTMLVGCSSLTFKPSVPYPGIPDYPDPGGEDPDIPGEPNLTVNFYKNYSNSADKDGKITPFYTMDWYSLKPLGELPSEAVLTDADAPDPLYPHFIGYSEYPTAIDESLLWDFAEDYKQGNILSLYGIWVKAQEDDNYEKTS